MSEMSSDEYKLSARTLPEVAEALKRMVALFFRDKSVRLSRQDGTDKKLTQAAVLSATILWVDALEREEQKQVIAGGVAILNRLLDGRDMPGEAPGPGRSTSSAGGSFETGNKPVAPVPPSRKKSAR